MHFSPLSCQFIPLRTEYSPEHPVLKHPQFMFLPLNIRDQVSHPYRTTGKIILSYILIFMFLDSRREDAFARIIKSRRMKCAGHVTSLGKLTNAYRISVDNLKGRDQFET
jgi:hypothetical protein